MTKKRAKKYNRLIPVLFTVYLLALCWLVLLKLQFSIPEMGERVFNLIPFMGSFDDNDAFRFSEIRNNILVFIPLGIYICMLNSWSLGRKIAAIFSLTFILEALQFVFAIGRADVTDLLSNMLGGIIGIGIYALLSQLLKGKTDRILTIFAAVITSLVLGFVAVLLLTHRWIIIQ